MLSLLLAATVFAATPQFNVQQVDGTKSSGAIVSLNQGGLTLKGKTGSAQLPMADLLMINERVTDAKKPSPPGALVQFRDGSLWASRSFRTKDPTATIQPISGEPVTIDIRAVRSVRFPSKIDIPLDQWNALAGEKVQGDQIVLRSKDGSLHSIEGVILSITDTQVQFDLDGDVIPVARSRIAGLIYYKPSKRKKTEPLATVSDHDGSVFHVADLNVKAEQLTLKTLDGIKLSRELRRITRIDFSPSKVRYLSQLVPESVKWTPLFEFKGNRVRVAEFQRFRKDGSLDGGKLALRMRDTNDQWVERKFARGLALHSRTELVYRIPSGYRRFRAVVGIDSRVTPSGNVRLVITADNKKLIDRSITGRDEPIQLDFDIAKVNRLKILVDYGDDLDVADHLNLCEAMVIK